MKSKFFKENETFLKNYVNGGSLKHIIISLLLILVFLMSVIPGGVFPFVQRTFAAPGDTHNIDITSFEQLKDEIENAVGNEIYNLTIKNDIDFSSVVLIKSAATINLINGGGAGGVKLTVTSAYRHFQTGSAAGTGTDVANATMKIGAGITLDGNKAGGGIRFFSSGGNLILNGCTIIDCYVFGAGAGGGGISIAGNTARSTLTIDGDARVENCFSNGIGGGLHCMNVDATLNSGVIAGNKANTGGGGVYINGSGARGAAFTMNGGKIDANILSLYWGQGAGINASDTVVTINDGEIINNENQNAGGHGGGIYMLRGTAAGIANLTINGGTIKNNKTMQYGGGISVDSINFAPPEFTMTGGLITENDSGHQGGGLYHIGGTITMTGGAITKNTAISGAGIFKLLGVLNVKGTAEISENTAASIAGGIYGYQGCTITIDENAKVINNTAKCNSEPENNMRGGGGIVLLSYGTVSTLTIKGNALISGNTATSYGGGIWTYPSFGPAPVVNIEGGKIEDNTANYGGGISMGEMAGLTPILRITGGIITNNTALKDGGGVIAKGSSVTVTDGIIKDNNATTGNGGGIYIPDSSTLEINGTATITGNKANDGQGGGIYAEDFNNLTVTGPNVKFSSNSASYVCDRDPANDAVYETNIINMSGNWTFPLTQGYNNYDINQAAEAGNMLYLLSYDTNGATPATIAPEYLRADDLIKNAMGYDTPLTKEGFTFDGWYLNDEFTIPVGDTAMGSSNRTIYAKWALVPSTYTVTYDKGTQGTFINQVTDGLLYGDPTPGFIGTPTSNSGYTFTGWSPVPSATVTGNATYVAQWTYTVIYEKGSQGTFKNQSKEGLTYGDLTPPFIGTPTGRPGYTFVGWSPIPGPIVTGNTTYVAMWKKNEEIPPVSPPTGDTGMKTKMLILSLVISFLGFIIFATKIIRKKKVM